MNPAEVDRDYMGAYSLATGSSIVQELASVFTAYRAALRDVFPAFELVDNLHFLAERPESLKALTESQRDHLYQQYQAAIADAPNAAQACCLEQAYDHYATALGKAQRPVQTTTQSASSALPSPAYPHPTMPRRRPTSAQLRKDALR